MEQLAGKIGKVRLKSTGAEIKIFTSEPVARRTIFLKKAQVIIIDFDDPVAGEGVRNDSEIYYLELAKEAILENL